jgi:Planctomycete cytochrome C
MLMSRLPAAQGASKLSSMKAPTQAICIGLLAGAMSSVHCSGGDDDVQSPPTNCVENLNIDCSPLLHDPPLYSTIYRDLIQPQCTLGSSCHSGSGAMGGLVLDNPDDTYDALLGLKGGIKRVLPRDPACSPLVVRLQSRDPNFAMPPGAGSRLSDAALCDFVQWIKQGAEKN